MAPIIRKAHKRTLILLGFVVSSIIGMLSGHFRGNYSKESSFLTPPVYADVPTGCNGVTLGNGFCCDTTIWTVDECTCFSCFPAGVSVTTPSGFKAIESLQIGDEVLAFRSDTGEQVTSKVTKTFIHKKGDPDTVFSPLLKITHEQGELLVTDNHWIYRKNDRDGDYANFDRAGMFVVGDKLTLADGSESSILSIEQGPECDTVYNLEVEGVHTYLAGGVRVHNSDGGGCCAGCGGCGCK